MIFADSSFFIALFRGKDSFHSRALELNQILKTQNRRLATTDHVLSEVLTYIKNKDGAQKTRECANKIIQARDVGVFFASAGTLAVAIDTTVKFEKFSFCDALSITLMQELGIKKIVSFDSDFDFVRNIERIY